MRNIRYRESGGLSLVGQIKCPRFIGQPNYNLSRSTVIGAIYNTDEQQRAYEQGRGFKERGRAPIKSIFKLIRILFCFLN